MCVYVCVLQMGWHSLFFNPHSKVVLAVVLIRMRLKVREFFEKDQNSVKRRRNNGKPMQPFETNNTSKDASSCSSTT